MKVLVTGASGFIGQHLVAGLLQKGIEVSVTASSAERLQQCAWYEQVTPFVFNLSTETDENLYEYFERPDKLIHLAWQGLPNYQSMFHLEENLPQHIDFLSNLIKNGLPDLTVTGTCFEYGMKEGCLSEEQYPEPTNPYALAKDTLRKYLVQLQQHHAFQYKWVRLFYMYGKGQNERSILAQLDQALAKGERIFNMSGGQQIRDYLSIEEVCKNMTSIALQDQEQGIINCCSGKGISIQQLVENRLLELGKEITLNLGYYPYPDYEPFAFWGDSTKLNRILSRD